MRSGQAGFTLLEVLLSVGIIVLLAGLSVPVYVSFNNRNDLDVATQSLAENLRRAEVYARGVKADDQWGVAVHSGVITLYKGVSYVARDTNYDEDTSVSSALTFGGLGEVVFTKLDAMPSVTGNITITQPNTNESKTVSINAKGMVDY